MNVEPLEVGSWDLEPGSCGDGGLVEGIEEMVPGVELGQILGGIDRTRLNGHHLVRLLMARARQVAMLQAEMYADMVELAHCPSSYPGSPPERQEEMDEFAADEIRAALTWTRRAAEFSLDLAWRLRERLPAVWEALHRGEIDLGRARVIISGTDHLAVDIADKVADTVLSQAPGLTTGQLGARLRRLCLEVDPGDAAQRYQQGVEARRLVSWPNPDGTTDLSGLSLPADRVAAIMTRIHHCARLLKTSHDPRSIDQIRADIFVDLLDGAEPSESRHRGMVDIRVDLTTLLGLAEHPGEIPGWGPVISDIARQVVLRQPDGEWRVVVTDPDTGNVLWDGTTRRRPTAAQARHVEARQPTCVFTGCRQPSRQSDLDHSLAVAEGGPTVVSNLDPLCRHDHVLKHDGGWQLRQPRPGLYVWTSRHGHTYTVHPP